MGWRRTSRSAPLLALPNLEYAQAPRRKLVREEALKIYLDDSVHFPEPFLLCLRIPWMGHTPGRDS